MRIKRYNRLTLTLFFLVLSTIVEAEDIRIAVSKIIKINKVMEGASKNMIIEKLQGSWMVKKGWFDGEVILLMPFTEDHRSTVPDFARPAIISFEKKGKLSISPAFSQCAVGSPIFKMLEWTIADDAIRIHIEGVNMGANGFIYDVAFTIANRDDGGINLLRKKRYNVQVWD